MAVLINTNKRNDYQNYDVLDKTIRYVTRNNGSDRSDLIGYGGAGVILHKGINNLIYSMELPQNIWNIGQIVGPKLYHWVLDLTLEETQLFHNDKSKMCQYAKMCSCAFWERGYQCIYGIHINPDNSIHIHFVISALNYIDGLRFSRETMQLCQYESYFNGLLNQYRHHCSG